MTEATVDSTTEGGALILHLRGSMDDTNGERLARRLHELSTRPSHPLVVLDLRDLDLLTGDGARALRRYARSLVGNGAACALVIAPDSAVALALDASDPSHLLPRFADLDGALHGSAPLEADDRETSRLANQFEALTRSLLREGTVADTLAHIVRATVHVVPNADLVSITLLTADGTFYTPVDTGPAAGELDQVQYRTGEGPCLDAARPEGPAYAISDDLGTERRWPRFARAATGLGYGAVIATALLPSGNAARLSGALNIYSHNTRGLTTTDRHSALLLATHASLALAHAHTAELAALRQLHLRKAMDSRDVIGQAKGILMNRQGITAEEAFALLSRTSQDLNVKLVDLATTLTSRHNELGSVRPES